MKIAFITAEYPPKNVGGAGISSQLIVESLRDRGHLVDVYSLTGDEQTCSQRQEGHYELYSGDNESGHNIVRQNISVYKYLPKTKQYDIIHVYSPGHLPASVLRSDVPVIATFVNFAWVCINSQLYLRDGCPKYDFLQALKSARSGRYTGIMSGVAPILEYIGKRINNSADVITVQTGGMKRILQLCGYDNTQIKIIPNILDPDFKFSATETNGNDSNTLVTVGRLVEEKGIFDIVRAFVKLSDNIKKGWNLEVYGEGPQRDTIESYLEKRDKNSVSINYCPYSDMPREVYRDAAGVIHGAKWPEPFSRVWLEAMASRTPIICTKNPSSRCILDGIAEFYDPFNRGSLMESLEKVMDSPDYRKRLATLGKQSVSQYEAERVVSRYEDTYDQVRN